jgi:hypothetical protein
VIVKLSMSKVGNFMHSFGMSLCQMDCLRGDSIYGVCELNQLNRSVPLGEITGIKIHTDYS